jgi:ABC-type sugar transport system permease subunit
MKQAKSTGGIMRKEALLAGAVALGQLGSAAAWILFVIILGITAVQFLGQKKWVHYDA